MFQMLVLAKGHRSLLRVPGGVGVGPEVGLGVEVGSDVAVGLDPGVPVASGDGVVGSPAWAAAVG